VPQGNIRLVSEGPPQILSSEGRQVKKENSFQDYNKAMDNFKRKKCYREYVAPDH
jgi:hypothetical protein